MSPLGVHGGNFSRLDDAMVGATDEIVVSFANLYWKTVHNQDRNGLVYGASPMEAKRTILAELAEIVAAQMIAARQKGNRRGCTCYLSRDIGAYDSCPHGCEYFCAVESRPKARRQHARHDPAGEFLI